jgi:DNA uptake protein ComE-like DNA-binding protein
MQPPQPQPYQRQPQPYQQPAAYPPGQPPLPGQSPPPGQSPYPQQGAQPVNIVNVHTHVQQPPVYAPPPVIVNDNSTIHVVHLILTIFTCGAWAPVWIIHAIIIAATSKPQPIYPVAPIMPMAPAPGPGFASGIPMDHNQEALAMVAQQSGKRLEARQLAAADPMTAMQLGIGRRDLPGRRYDDGGLIDVNRVPAEIFTHFSGITAERAAHIITVRDSLGGAFSSAEELMAMAELPPHLADEIAEYAIIMR